jgi:IS1 family transposase
LRSSPEDLDRVAHLAIEGVSKAACGRLVGASSATVTRWIEKCARHAAVFSDGVMRQVPAEEVQMDELKSHARSKRHKVWLFTSIDVSSRLWFAQRLGRRTLRDTRLHMRETRDRSLQFGRRILLSTDRFVFYGKAAVMVLGPNWCYVQVHKAFQKGKIRRTRHRVVLGSWERVDEALRRSEDSTRPNTSYVERLNLTIRRSIAALQRKTTAWARSPTRLLELLVLLQAYLNFVRPHRSLKFGKVCRTPAMQASLAPRPLSLREIFMAPQGWCMRDPGRPEPNEHGAELIRRMLGNV